MQTCIICHMLAASCLSAHGHAAACSAEVACHLPICAIDPTAPLHPMRTATVCLISPSRPLNQGKISHMHADLLQPCRYNQVASWKFSFWPPAVVHMVSVPAICKWQWLLCLGMLRLQGHWQDLLFMHPYSFSGVPAPCCMCLQVPHQSHQQMTR